MDEETRAETAIEDELSELQARMAAVELLLTDLLAHARATSPELRTWLEGREETLKLMMHRLEHKAGTHYRYLKCSQNLLAQAQSEATLLEPWPDD